MTEAESVQRRTHQRMTIALIVCAVAGIVLSFELTHIHYKVNTDPEFSSFCNIGEAVNCETVAASSYSQVFGVPISVWGLFAYGVLLVLALAGTRRDDEGTPLGLPLFLLAWGAAGLAATLVLAYISFTLIASFCLLCAALYAVNLVVFGLAIGRVLRTGGLRAAVRRDLGRLAGQPVVSAAVALALLGISLGLVLGYPRFQLEAAEPPEEIADEACDSGNRTIEGFSYFGGQNAKVTIEEYSDYQCGHCRNAHYLLRKLISTEYPERVRLIHRHYPLDEACHPQMKKPFHTRACAASQAAICADRQGKFWEYNDLLFANGRALEKKHLVGYARNLELDVSVFERCLVDPHTETELQRDLRDGIGWGVRGTPCFVVNGTFVKGAKSEATFRELIEDALGRCEQPPTPPVPIPAVP